MDNKLFKNTHVREVTLANGIILKYETTYNLRYGIQKEETKETSEWKDLLKSLNYKEEFEGHMDRKKRLWCPVEYYDKHYNWKQAKVYKDNFVSMKIYNKVRFFELKYFRMKELIEELNGEEFIKLLKDNEIGYIGSI